MGSKLFNPIANNLYVDIDKSKKTSTVLQVRGLILDQGREFYDVQVVDLNRDGRLDVLVTVVSSNGGSVEVWEPTPGNFRFE